MVESQEYAQEPQSARSRDLEEKQKLLKDRVLLLGENLIDLRSEVSHDVGDMKRTLEVIKEDIDKMKDVLKRLSEEIDSKARKEDLAILQRQSKIFDPLKFATLEDVEEMLDSKLK